ncbi:MAG TPA: hypothetical protein VGX25_05030 [Actinophytocola sp.]|uniref:hypothetical protein n=1 Tax=Actinophytocola sp. TaxID=1872138 RepID=UPI002DDCBAE3|nr:hypothetical protein [Actinophytocola sp.]HEV2778745.1 hypothetical protein [Actinophytocola sp.]
MRTLFAVAGLTALAWGAWLAWDFATASARDGLQALAWFVGGPVAHDAILAPAVGVAGLLIARGLPRAWRAPVAVGGVLSGVLALLAIPLLWRPVGVPANPGLHDADYVPRLLITLGVVWLGVLIAGLTGSRTRAGEG